MPSRHANRNITLSIALAGSLAAMRLWQRRHYEISGKTVFISGGSRGLGLVLARECAARGAKVAISARDGEALRRAEADVRRFGKHVLAIETDITMREEAEMALDQRVP